MVRTSFDDRGRTWQARLGAAHGPAWGWGPTQGRRMGWGAYPGQRQFVLEGRRWLTGC